MTPEERRLFIPLYILVALSGLCLCLHILLGLLT
jgi:hypothetical protein